VLLVVLWVGLDRHWTDRLRLLALVLLAFACVLAPWAVRNARLQHTFVAVDVLGGFNLRMGNYEYTLEDRMWDTVALTGERNWSAELAREQPGVTLTEGQKEQWARRKAVEYMLRHPLTTARRSAIRFGDFWGLEREIIAGFQTGLYRPPAWFVWLTAGAITVSYVALVFGAVGGAWLAPAADRRVHWLLILPILFITAVHTLVFGHSRYHLPLVPLLCLFAASAIVSGAWRHASPPWRRWGAVATLVVLVIAWGRQVALVDSARLRLLLERIL
jgi:hypothetical protein